MASLSEAKSLGGIGAILAIIPGINVVGWVLVLFAIKNVSEVLQDRTIFDDAIIAAITSVVGSIAFVVLLFGGYFFALVSFAPSGTPGPGIFFAAIIVLLVTWAFEVVSAVFLKRASDNIGQRLNIGAFGTTGILCLIGSLLTVVFIGFLIVFIALIFQIVAFFSIQDQPPPPMWTPQPLPPSAVPPTQPAHPNAAPQQPPSEFKYCFKCGAKLESSAAFCNNCGAKLS